jgi:hypothetical protein
MAGPYPAETCFQECRASETKADRYHLGIECRRLFRPLFTDLSTWSAWIVFLKATFGIEMDAAELDTFQR